MRPELLRPVRDVGRLRAAVVAAEELYRLHEMGRDYSGELRAFGELVGREVSKSDLKGAFGSVRAESFAENLMADRARVPRDLAEGEMLELVERLCAGEGTEFQIAYWIDCLAVNTGDERVSDLIYWPGEYFGDGDGGRELSAGEILRVALGNGAKRRSGGRANE